MNNQPKFPRKSFRCLLAIMLLASTLIWQFGVGAQSKRSTVSPGGQQVKKEAAKPAIPPPPPPPPWTSAGATGTVDPASASLVSFDDFAVQLKDTLTGSVTIRYNITAVKGISAFCPATQSVVNVRFRNSDNTGVLAQVKFEIHRSHSLNGGNDIIYSFNSNGVGAGNAFTTVSAAPNIDFDFSNYVYWIEGTVFRNQAAQFADLGEIQIYETAGTTPC
jgi:hypothetical protein